MKIFFEILIQGLITTITVGAILMSFGLEKNDFLTLLSGKLPEKKSTQPLPVPTKRISGSQTPDEPEATAPSPVLTTTAEPTQSTSTVITTNPPTLIKVSPASKIAGESRTDTKKIEPK
jgi:hypothetical protein